ncbi:hypothetical protein TNCV_4772031 [Trichonephila clavipes]|nr:hypothetical protein TNCV_4772031 [Trichonephila clavipes]
MAKTYRDTILEPIAELLNVNLSNGNDWTFQQNSAPNYMSKTTQWLLKGYAKTSKIGLPALHLTINCGQYWRQRCA